MRLLPTNRIFALAALSLVVMCASIILIYRVGVPSPNFLAGSASAATLTPANQPASALEMHVANDGLVFLRGVRVVSISGNDIHVAMSYQTATFLWLIRVDASTKFFTSQGEKGTSADMQIGQQITVTGMLAGGGAEPTIDAQFIRD